MNTDPHRLRLALAGLLMLAGAAFAQAPPEPGPPPAEPAAAAPQAGSPVAAEPTRMSLLELLMKGRWFMIPIGACSLLGVAIIIERLLALRRSQIMPSDFLDGLKDVLQRGAIGRDAGLNYCHTNDSPISRVAAAGLRKLHRDEESIEQAIEDAGANEVAKLRRNLRMLYGVSAVAPMLGLLGTVWGMIEAFQVASSEGLGQAEMLAQGIYEALVTTFAGLCVAIPVLIFYYFFLGKIERIVAEMNDISVEFVEHYTVAAQHHHEEAPAPA